MADWQAAEIVAVAEATRKSGSLRSAPSAGRRSTRASTSTCG